jgi:formylglycine-generating enzyme required for sulfatase activity
MQQTRLGWVLALGAVVVACGGGSGSQRNGSSADGGQSGTDDGPGGATGTSGGSGLPGCNQLPNTCGPSQNESCCASNAVPGGYFERGFDGVNYTNAGYPATVSAFQLDRFLVTVGRFRSFVTAVENGWLPPAGSGKHAHLNNGGGLNGGSEPGWDPSSNAMLATKRADWDSNLLCDPTLATWTSDAAGNEQRPINCVLWEEAYAFCTWDGGFLPSEAESNFAAAGGTEQRVYAWSSPASSTDISCADANYNPGTPCTGALNDVGSESPKGDGKWGHADLAGNVWEWILDYYAAPYAIQQCTDCADLASGGIRVIRGGTFFDGADLMAVSYRHNYSQTGHSPLFSVRCARAPH